MVSSQNQWHAATSVCLHVTTSFTVDTTRAAHGLAGEMSSETVPGRSSRQHVLRQTRHWYVHRLCAGSDTRATTDSVCARCCSASMQGSGPTPCLLRRSTKCSWWAGTLLIKPRRRCAQALQCPFTLLTASVYVITTMSAVYGQEAEDHRGGRNSYCNWPPSGAAQLSGGGLKLAPWQLQAQKNTVLGS